ncbi:MAG: ATP-dependent Clp protease proteolytic subunit [Leptolyngbya sp. SIO3F4]|nr:ATP-dependent Clp protease proteolytic subunit [Leptolyngbya sp. SIO3F4]
MTDYNEFEKFAVKDQGIGSHNVHQYVKASLTPYILEERQLNVQAMDVFSRLMMDRVIFLGTPVNDQVANIIQAQLLFMQSSDPTKDVYLYINSPGGSVYAGLGIYDTMHYVTPDVATTCTGLAASMAAVLLTAGADKKRASLKHSRIMIHQPMSGTQGQVSDMEIALKETTKVRDELYNILANHTGQTFDKIKEDSDRDYWMSAEEARDYGMIDEVLTKGK